MSSQNALHFCLLPAVVVALVALLSLLGFANVKSMAHSLFAATGVFAIRRSAMCPYKKTECHNMSQHI